MRAVPACAASSFPRPARSAPSNTFKPRSAAISCWCRARSAGRRSTASSTKPDSCRRAISRASTPAIRSGPKATRPSPTRFFIQLGRRVPGTVVLPTGYGELLFGVAKGFRELKDLGVSGCSPANVLGGARAAGAARACDVAQRGGGRSDRPPPRSRQASPARSVPIAAAVALRGSSGTRADLSR